MHGKSLLMLLLGLTLASSPALADKPEKGNHGKASHAMQRDDAHDSRGRQATDERQQKKPDQDKHKDKRHKPRPSAFNDEQRGALHAYYNERMQSGDCPPGLAKKNNGCQPPGQAKKWRKGHALPKTVRYYNVPPEIVVRLGPPPSGHKYVRIASDILMIAIGTSMVVDAIEDLGR